MANPTAREQEFLELINRMRMSPAAELALLINSSDPDIQAALTYFNVNLDTLRTQWSNLTAVAPLAWSSQLNDVASAHNQKMIQYDQQSHQVGVYDRSGTLITAYESDITGRITAGNSTFTYWGENIYAYGKSILHADAGFAIDWGGTAATGGIQNPPGHRDNMMLRNYREVGISVTDETNPSTKVGPLVVTQDFGNRSTLNGKAWLLGAAFQDINKDGWYEAGEGLNDVQVKITGINGTTFANTISVASAGGYQDLLNPGQYQVDFIRNGATVSTRTTSIGTDNVKIDLRLNLATRNDFNGDRKTDILWRNNDRSLALWQMNGSTATPSSIGIVPLGWTIAGTSDFNGDSKADILLSNTNGAVATWEMNGSIVSKTNTLSSTLTSGWSLAGTSDFNGDSNAEILLRNTDGRVATWEVSGSTVTKSSIIGTANADWSIAGTSDFNGDRKADILLSKADGTVALWQMDGATVVQASIVNVLSTGWSIAGTADFNGDGKADILLRNTDGSVAQWNMNGANITGTNALGFAPIDWKIAGTGDLNDDGKADIFWRNTNGNTATWQSGANGFSGGLTSIQADSTWNIAAPIG
jgi:uncharacterized protein YkwD